MPTDSMTEISVKFKTVDLVELIHLISSTKIVDVPDTVDVRAIKNALSAMQKAIS